MATLQDVITDEFKIIQKRRLRTHHPGYGKDDSAPGGQKGEFEPSKRCENLIGLALSGGGIRSSTTNIGVLQGLSERGILRFVDYLSTVSGGGYIGACLSSLLSDVDKDNQAVFTTEWGKFPFREDRIKSGQEDPNHYGRDQMNHIRTRASYLAPRARHLSPDVMRALGAVFISTCMTLLWFALVIVLITSAYMAVVSHVAPDLVIKPQGEVAASISSKIKSNGAFSFSVEAEVKGQKIKEKSGKSSLVWDDLSGIFESAKEPFKKFTNITWTQDALVRLLIPLLGVFLVFGGGSSFMCASSMIEKRYDLCFGLIFFLALAFLGGETSLFLGHQIKEFSEGAILVIPPLFVLVALAGVWCAYLVISRCDEEWKPDRRSRLQTITGMLIVTLLLTLIWAMLPGFMILGADNFIALLLVAIGAAIRYAVASKKTGSGKKEKGFSLPSKYKEWLLGISIFVFLCLAVVYAGNVITDLLFEGKWLREVGGQYSSLWLVSLGALFSLVLFNFLVDVNKISPHYFYRDRLADAFLKTGNFGKGFCRNDAEMRLAELHGSESSESNPDEKALGAARGPYLLLNATLNLTASKDLKAFHRKSGIFTFSRLYVGSRQTGYLPTAAYAVDGCGLKLARAMAISGAAVTSVMGMNTSLAQSFACTIFGVRLGYWLPNLKKIKIKERRSSANMRLLHEMFAHTTAQDEEIYLSDGGHSGDNLGIIPLLQRRVRVVIVSDSECDSHHTFDSFNSSVRNAYVDKGIRVEISLDGLKKNEKGLTRDKIAVGRIFYPDQGEDQKNWIILFKNTLNGQEISPIVNYKEKNEDFPHESTADQFFTEQQFESYRALGRFAVLDASGSETMWLQACSASDRSSSKEAYHFLKKMMVR